MVYGTLEIPLGYLSVQTRIEGPPWVTEAQGVAAGVRIWLGAGWTQVRHQVPRQEPGRGRFIVPRPRPEEASGFLESEPS